MTSSLEKAKNMPSSLEKAKNMPSSQRRQHKMLSSHKTNYQEQNTNFNRFKGCLMISYHKLIFETRRKLEKHCKYVCLNCLVDKWGWKITCLQNSWENAGLDTYQSYNSKENCQGLFTWLTHCILMHNVWHSLNIEKIWENVQTQRLHSTFQK